MGATTSHETPSTPTPPRIPVRLAPYQPDVRFVESTTWEETKAVTKEITSIDALRDLLEGYRQDYEYLATNGHRVCDFDTIPEVKQARAILAKETQCLTSSN
jgi:hypothetical protein